MQRSLTFPAAVRSRAPDVRLLLLIAVALLGCQGRTDDDSGFEGSGARPPIVLISIDTLRSDRLPAYGYTAVATPALDALRRDAILFERAYCHTPLTLPSHVSVLTGLLPPEHGIRDNQGYRFDAGGALYLPRRLREIGYATGGVVSAFLLGPASGLAEGFDFYDAEISPAAGQALGGVARPGGETLERAVAWLRSRPEGPPFLFFHVFEPHMPYNPPEPFASRYADPYDGEIAAADQVVGGLLDELKRLGLYEPAVVVLFSDHGEGLGDHGEQEHGVFLYREALQVPLLLKLPRGERAGTTVAEPAQLVDLVPTLLALAGVRVPEELPGRSLLELSGAPSRRRIYAETFFPRLHYGWSELASLIDGRHHYIEAPEPELFDLVADPGEHNNVLARERRVYAALRRELSSYERELEAPAAADPEERAKLAALGYLGSAGPVRGALPDPKRKFPTLELLASAYGHYRRAEHEAAVTAFQEVLAENPGMIDAREYLAESLLHLGRPAEALQALRQAFDLSGGEPRLALKTAAAHLRLGELDDVRELVAYGERRGEEARDLKRRLGLALAEAGRAGEALAVLRPLAADGEVQAMNALGLALSESGDQSGAYEVLRRLLAVEPDNAVAYEHLGLAALRSGRFREAAEHSRRAVEIDGRRGRAWNNLGVAVYNQGQPELALDAWDQALKVDPQDYDVLYNLAVTAFEQRQVERSRQALKRFVATAPRERYAAELKKAAALLQQLGVE